MIVDKMRTKLECGHQGILIFDDEYFIHEDCYGVAYHCAKCGKEGFVYLTYHEWRDMHQSEWRSMVHFITRDLVDHQKKL